MKFSEEDGNPFVTFTDELTRKEYKVCCDQHFFHIFTENGKKVPREGHTMLTNRGTKTPTIVLDRFLGAFRVCVLQ